MSCSFRYRTVYIGVFVYEYYIYRDTCDMRSIILMRLTIIINIHIPNLHNFFHDQNGKIAHIISDIPSSISTNSGILFAMV